MEDYIETLQSLVRAIEKDRIMGDIEEELSAKISKQTSNHACAMFYGSFNDLLFKGSAEFIEAQGTMTFVKHNGKCFGITNGHVVGDYERPTSEKVFNLALIKHCPIPGRLIFKSIQNNPDYPFDIAIFELDENRIIKGGKKPIDLSGSYKRLEEGDQALAIGFPKIRRHKRDGLTMAHGFYHVVAKCIGASDRKIILHECLPDKKEKNVKFGGMSGGPIFKLHSNSEYSFSGILFEGKGFGDVNDGHPISDEIWVYGFPLNGAELIRAIDLA